MSLQDVKTNGIVGGMGLRVRILGYRTRPNEFIKPGTVGILVPNELSVDGDVIHGNFYPMAEDGTYHGFGGVMWPIFESVQVVT